MRRTFSDLTSSMKKGKRVRKNKRLLKRSQRCTNFKKMNSFSNLTQKPKMNLNPLGKKSKNNSNKTDEN